jgi:acyl carrier protein
VELGEVEAHLNLDPSTKQGLALLPKHGPFSGRLISVLSLSTKTDIEYQDLGGLRVAKDFSKQSHAIRERLLTLIPSYMVPSGVIIIDTLPLMPSGKVDRRRITKWAEEIDDDTYRWIIEASTEIKMDAPATEIESKLRSIWSHVLNLRLDQVELNSSFLSLGGDSISAMQVKGQCSKQDISLSVQNILLSKSITELAHYAKPIDRPSHIEEVIERPFALSPIQTLFFKLPNQGKGHFNQSFFLRLTRKVQKKDLRQAIEIVIGRHSMLRARFSQTEDGTWQQRITNDTEGSYSLKAYDINKRDEAIPAIAKTQATLDYIKGPIFAADIFHLENGDQLLFLVGHHLVLDLVSWRVILEDLEEILQDTHKLSSEKPLSFQTWCIMQADHCQNLSVRSFKSFYCWC